MVFGQNLKVFTLAKKKGGGGGVSSERASQEEQNGTNFSFIAPSSEELWVQNKTVDYSLWFWHSRVECERSLCKRFLHYYSIC